MNSILGVVALFVISATTLFAQFPPASFKNLQVLHHLSSREVDADE